MKLIFNLLLFLSLANTSFGHARDIVLIENLSSDEEGEVVKKILNEKYKIPIELISLRLVQKNCSLKSEAIMHICIEENGELKVARMNKFVVRNALGVFKKNFDVSEN